MHAYNAKEIIFSILIQDANYNYHDMLKNFPDISSGTLNYTLMVSYKTYTNKFRFTKKY